MKNKKVSFIISNFNGEKIISLCLPSIIEELEKGDEIIFADDCSSDKSCEIVKNIYPNIKIIKTPKNLGYAGNNNNAVKYAKNEILFFINNDAFIEKGVTKKLKKLLLSNEKIFAVSPIIYDAKDKNKIYFAPTYVKWKKGLIKIAIDKDFHKQNFDVIQSFTLCGCAFMCRKNDFLKLGGFDEIYNPFYFEDSDLFFKARCAGFDNLCTKEAKVYHYSGWTIFKEYEYLAAKVITVRNRYIFHWKNLPISLLIKKHIFVNLFYLIKSLFNLQKKKDRLGFIEALKLLPKIIKKRNENKFLIKNAKIILKEFERI